MKRLKKIGLCLLVGALSMSMVACGQTQVAKDVVATVNGEAITQSDYDKLYNEYLEYFGGSDEAKEYLAGQKKLLLDELVTNKVLFQKADELGITCTQQEIDDSYKKLEDQYGKETVEQMLATSGMTADGYKEMLKEQLILAKLQEIMIEGDTTVTEAEAKAYYEENIDQYTIGAGANMKHILINVTADDDATRVAEGEAALKELEAEIASGTSFDTLVEKYSDKENAGDIFIVEDLGFVQYDEPNFDPDFLAGVKEVGEGQVSGPIKSSFGYHFVKVDGITEEKVSTFEEVSDEVYATLKEEKQYALYEACLNRWIEEAKVVKYEDHIQ